MPIGSGFGDDDIDTFFVDFGVPLTEAGTNIGPDGTPKLCVFDTETDTHQFPTEKSEILAGTSSALVRAKDFIGNVYPKRNAVVTVDGLEYIVNYTKIEADGRTGRLFVRKNF